MQEDKEQKSSESAGAGQDAQAEATSSETLSDVEETEKASTEKSDTGGSSMPSPDGQFDSDGGSSSPKDNPGPM